jgi:hypothetical protein
MEMTADPVAKGVKVPEALDVPAEIVSGLVVIPTLELLFDSETVTVFPVPNTWMAAKLSEASNWAIETVSAGAGPPFVYADKLAEKA